MHCVPGSRSSIVMPGGIDACPDSGTRPRKFARLRGWLSGSCGGSAGTTAADESEGSRCGTSKTAAISPDQTGSTPDPLPTARLRSIPPAEGHWLEVGHPEAIDLYLICFYVYTVKVHTMYYCTTFHTWPPVSSPGKSTRAWRASKASSFLSFLCVFSWSSALRGRGLAIWNL